jgi:hypothetical protein
MSSTLSQFEGERVRRLSIDASHLAAEIGLQKLNRRESAELFEGERERQVGEIEGARKQEEESRAEVREGVRKAVELERARRLSLVPGEFIVEGVTRLNEELASHFGRVNSLVAFDQEQCRRIGEAVFSEAAARAESLNLRKSVVEAEERVRWSYRASQVFYEAAALAESKALNQKVLESQEILRTKSIATLVFEEAAYQAERKRILAEIVEAEEVERKLRSVEKPGSLLFKTIVDELSIFHERLEKLMNQKSAIEAMELERIRRLTVEEAYIALEDYARIQSRKSAAVALDTERTRRIASAVFEDAAAKALVLQNRKNASESIEIERVRRILDLSNTGYVLF